MRYCLLIGFIFFACSSFSQDVSFSSRYTHFNEKECPVMQREGQMLNYQRCPLFGHYYLLLTKDNYGKFFLTVGNDSLMYFHSVQLAGCGVSRDFGPSVEWRLANDVPFAGIVQYHCLETDTSNRLTPPIASFVVVFGLQGFADIDIEVDMNDTPDALSVARQMADDAYMKHFRKEKR